MKQSEVFAGGKEILDQVFSGLLLSKDKEEWQKAFYFVNKKIAELEAFAYLSDSSILDIQNLWMWKSCRRQLSQRYGKKFIIPHLSSLNDTI